MVLILEHVISANVRLQHFPFSGKTSPPKTTEQSILGLCSNQQLSFFTLLDRTYFLHYNNTKIIKFGWKLFILWVISYRLSFLGFAINLSSCLETLEIGQIPKMTVHDKCLIKWTVFQPNSMILMLNIKMVFITWSIHTKSNKINCPIRAKPWKSTVSTVPLFLGHTV